LVLQETGAESDAAAPKTSGAPSSSAATAADSSTHSKTPGTSTTSAEHGITAAQVAAAVATCAASHGDPQLYSSVDELRSLVAGSWVYCGTRTSATGMFLSESWVGLEFASGGRLYGLDVDETTGGLERDMGFQPEPNYTASGNASDDYIRLTISNVDKREPVRHRALRDGATSTQLRYCPDRRRLFRPDSVSRAQ
jgi:hypothetical protein